MNFKKSNNYDSTKFKYYYENISVAFTSLRVFNPSVSLVLFTTGEVPEIYSKILNSIDVEIKNVEVNYVLKNDKTNRFSGSLFLLDCIKNQKRNTLYLDPDVICLSSLDCLQVNNTDIFVYEVQEFIENKDSLKRILSFLGEDSNLHGKKMKYYGGEFFFIPQNRLNEINKNIESIWNRNISYMRSSVNYLQTEEHFLTLALRDLRSVKCTGLISRLWTTRSYRKIPKNYAKLPLIHLPAEKDKGISTLFSMIYREQEDANIEIFSSENRKKLFRVLGISKNIAGAIKFQFFRLIKISFSKIGL